MYCYITETPYQYIILKSNRLTIDKDGTMSRIITN